MNKRILSILSGVAGLVLSGAIYSVVRTFPVHAVEAARYVKFLLAVMAVLCVILIAVSARGNDTSKPVWIKAPCYVFACTALTLIYAWSMPYAGFYVSSVIYVLALALALGLRRWVLLLVSTALLIAVVYGVFVSFLGVPVPLGIFEEFSFADIPGSIEKAKLAWSVL